MTEQPTLLSVETRPLRDPSNGLAKLSLNPIACWCGARGFGFSVLVRKPYTEHETQEPMCLDCTIKAAVDHGYPEGFEWVRELTKGK